MENTKKLILTLALLTIIATAFIINEKITTANTIKEQKEKQEFREWLVDNCECVEKNITRCWEGFELSEDEKRCRKEGKITNVLKSCSRYDCDGEINEITKEYY